MINPDLERRYADCSELVDSWKSYLEYYNLAVKSEDFSPTADLEQAFLDAKARIAMLHDSFMASLKHDQNIAQNMLSIVNRSITLRHLRKASSADQKKIEIEWHEVYLLLNETVSRMAEDREKLADRNEFTYRIGKAWHRVQVNSKAFAGSVYFKLIIGFGVLGVIAVVLLTQTFEPLRQNNATAGLYGTILDFRRDVLGFSAPYSSIDKLMDGKLASDNLPDGYNRQNIDSPNRESLAGEYAQAFTVGGTDAAEFLGTANEVREITLQAEETAPPIRTVIFYWDESGPALNFSLAAQQAANSGGPWSNYLRDSVTIFQDENAAIILSNGFPEQRAQVRREAFGR